MSESCNSRHFSWLMKSCFPNPHDTNNKSLIQTQTQTQSNIHIQNHLSTLSSLPDDLLLECLSRLPPSSLPSLSLVCRRWARFLDSSSFFDLRRRQGRIHNIVFAVSATDYGLFAASLRFHDDEDDADWKWKVSLFLANDAVSLGNFHGLLSQARLSAIGPRIFIIGRNAMVRYDTWSGTVVARSSMIFPRKKFATAVVSGKIYAAGGGSRTDAVEEYDPHTDTWRVVSNAPRRRYGCIGASVDGVFYVIGGLKIGAPANEFPRATANAEAHVYASSMDLYDVEARVWLRSRAVPGGGCVVAACAAAGHVYVLASHAVELSFWKFDARRKSISNTNNTITNNSGFGEWCRLKSPPLPAQVRLDSTVRFSCVGVEEKVVLVQVTGCIDDLLRRSGRTLRGLREGLVLVYDSVGGEWSRGPDLPEVIRRAACVCVEC
uniref:F-box domain-containing protein n=1 Tax=Fagus sylvatica TaxID=28930 RepID=A0A2N9FX83_FAGSY